MHLHTPSQPCTAMYSHVQLTLEPSSACTALHKTVQLSRLSCHMVPVTACPRLSPHVLHPVTGFDPYGQVLAYGAAVSRCVFADGLADMGRTLNPHSGSMLFLGMLLFLLGVLWSPSRSILPRSSNTGRYRSRFLLAALVLCPGRATAASTNNMTATVPDNQGRAPPPTTPSNGTPPMLI